MPQTAPDILDIDIAQRLRQQRPRPPRKPPLGGAWSSRLSIRLSVACV
jgi:hypothetical protein